MNVPSDTTCPYKKCDGKGIILYHNWDTGKTRSEFCKCREENIYKKKLKFAHIPEEFEKLTINSFNPDIYSKAENKAIAKQARKLTAGFVMQYPKFKNIGKGLYLYSKTKGSGKTRLAVSLGNVLIKDLQQNVRFITSTDLIKTIQSTYNTSSEITEDKILSEIKNVEVLILDDIGVEKISDWVNEMLFNILDHRMKFKKITIFTSNAKIEDLQHDDRIKSRLHKMCLSVKMPEEDARTFLAETENEKLEAELLGL